jgi:hypothetical protein
MAICSALETIQPRAHYAEMDELPPLNIHVIADRRPGRYRWRIIEQGKSRYTSMRGYPTKEARAEAERFVDKITITTNGPPRQN